MRSAPLLLLFSLGSAQAAPVGKLHTLEEICADKDYFKNKDVRASPIADTFQRCAGESSDPQVAKTASSAWKYIQDAQGRVREKYAQLCEYYNSTGKKTEGRALKDVPTSDADLEQCDSYRELRQLYFTNLEDVNHTFVGCGTLHLDIVQGFLEASRAVNDMIPESPTDWKATGDLQCRKELSKAKVEFFGRLPKDHYLASRSFLAQPTTRSFFHEALVGSEGYLRRKEKQLDGLVQGLHKAAELETRCDPPNTVPTGPLEWICQNADGLGMGQGATEQEANAKAKQVQESLCKDPKYAPSGYKYVPYLIECTLFVFPHCHPYRTVSPTIRG